MEKNLSRARKKKGSKCSKKERSGDTELAQAEKVQEAADRKLQEITAAYCETSRTNIENSKSEIMALPEITGQRIRENCSAMRNAEPDSRSGNRDVNQSRFQMRREEMGQEELLKAREERTCSCAEGASGGKMAERELAAEKKNFLPRLQQQITICRKRREDGQKPAYHREASRLESLQKSCGAI